MDFLQNRRDKSGGRFFFIHPTYFASVQCRDELKNFALCIRLCLFFPCLQSHLLGVMYQKTLRAEDVSHEKCTSVPNTHGLSLYYFCGIFKGASHTVAIKGLYIVYLLGLRV